MGSIASKNFKTECTLTMMPRIFQVGNLQNSKSASFEQIRYNQMKVVLKGSFKATKMKVTWVQSPAMEKSK